jgi:predicted DCC family thiol-disulfide oxidoreductase YuxK
MLHIAYDGQCGFCRRSLALARRVDVWDRLRFHDANDQERVLRAFPELAGADFANAMFAVDERRRVTRGFFAFRQIMRQSPLTWLLLPLFYLPGSGVIGPRVYAWVAANRRRFGCESEMCELPPQPRPGRD